MFISKILTNKINKNTMNTQINHFNKYDLVKQQFQTTLRKLGNHDKIGFSQNKLR